MEYWKIKLTHILHSNQFCGICLSTDDVVNTVSDEYEIVVSGKSHNKTLDDIVDTVFKEGANLASSQICNTCTNELLQSYIFIEQARETLRTVQNCINDLYNKTYYIHNNILKEDNNSSKLYNIIIALDKNHFTEEDNYAIHSKEETITKEKKEMVINRRKFKCLFCNIILPSYKAWRYHTTTHKNKFKCKKCPKTFKSQISLANHTKSHQKMRCKICLRLIKYGGLLAHLIENHEHSSRVCSQCNIAFYSSKDLEAHMKEWHCGGDRKCLTCFKSYTEKELEEHKCSFSCDSCSETVCVHHKYLTHYRVQILNNILQAKCLNCQFVCRTKEALIKHVDRCHLNRHTYPRDKCAKTLNSELNTRVRDSRRNIICQYCDMQFDNQSLYESHRKDCEDTKIIKTEQRPMVLNASKSVTKLKIFGRRQDIFPCGFCNKIYLDEAARKRHMIQTHSGQRKTKDVTLDCAICQTKFSTRRDLVHHMKSHGSSTKYPCRICNTQYETLRQFRAHNRKHIGPFAVCEVCGKEMRQILLNKHMTTHTNSVVTCETCGQSFQNTALLKYHQKVHLASVPCPKCNKLINPAKLRRHFKNHIIQEDPALKAAAKQTPNLKCGLCEYKTWNNILLECHMNRHHLKVKPYICHICSKAFIGKHLLKKHIDTHTVEKNVTCMICMKKFANAACLKMHLRLHTGERPFTCEICGDRFRSSSILNVHKLKKHSEKNNMCPICQNKFHTVRDLRRHIIKVHWKDKDKKFDPRELIGLSKEHYHLFHDGRRVKVDKEDLEFYVP